MKISHTGEKITLKLTKSESELLSLLATQLAEVIDDAAPEDADVLLALFPDAYREDAEAAAEFGRLTRSDLDATKGGRAREIAAAARASGTISLDVAGADRWASALTDIRLMVGTRLGIVTDEDEPGPDLLGDIYRWLGDLQWVLVDALIDLTPVSDQP